MALVVFAFVFPSALLRYNWHITFTTLRCTMWWFSCTCILWNDYHHKVSQQSITSHNYYLSFNLYSLINFQVYNTLLVTIVTTLSAPEQPRTYSCYNGKFVPFDQHPPIFPHFTPWRTPFYCLFLSVSVSFVCLILSFLSFFFLLPHIQIRVCVGVYVCVCLYKFFFIQSSISGHVGFIFFYFSYATKS